MSQASPVSTIRSARIRCPRGSGGGGPRRWPAASGSARRPRRPRSVRIRSGRAASTASHRALPSASSAASRAAWPAAGVEGDGQQPGPELGARSGPPNSSSSSTGVGRWTSAACSSSPPGAAPPAQVGVQGHHQLLAERVDRRVGHLGEALLEEGVEGPGLARGRRSGRRRPSTRRRPAPPPHRLQRSRAGPRGCSRRRATGGAGRSAPRRRPEAPLRVPRPGCGARCSWPPARHRPR